MAPPSEFAWSGLPHAARVYIAAVIAAGAAAAVTFFPVRFDHPVLFLVLLSFVYVTSMWKVNLPLALSNGSTLSVSYAADLASLLLLGPQTAMLIAMSGAWAQCSLQVKRTYPVYRTIFSIAVLALTMRAVAAMYFWLDGAAPPVGFTDLPKPLVGMIATYFLVNTALVAVAITLTTRQPLWPVWRDNFLWSAPSFIVAGGAGALVAVVIARGDYWLAPLMAAPVYLTYRTYHVSLARIEIERRHLVETRTLHEETLQALALATEAQRALAAEKERLAVTLRSIGEGVIATDLYGHVRLLNRAAEMLTGWRQDEALGRPLGDVFRNVDPDSRDPYDNSVPSVARSDQPVGVGRSALLVSRDGTARPIEEVSAPLRDDGRTIGMVVAFRDASDTIKIQEERAKASKLASLGLLAGGIAHDFNNILTAILGNISLARALSPPVDELDAVLTEAERACIRARQLTQQLLTFAKGGAPIKKTLRLDRLLTESASLALSGSSVRWSAAVDPDLWPVKADEGQLIQVFNNIIINAQQAMPRGGRVSLAAENIFEPGDRWEYGLKVTAGPYVKVSIKDEGTGIPEQDRGRIFEPYFSTKEKGSGLGLATSHSIVKNHGGYIAVRSAVGEGTTVSVSLPGVLAGKVDDAVEALEAEPLLGGRVLVLDDEAPIRALATSLLRLLGYEAETASSGEAAIERYKIAMAQDRPFDVVMLDLTIPGGMGGREVIQALIEIDPNVKAIVFSGYTQDAVMASYREYGFKAVVPKPFTPRELSKALREVAEINA
jgi:PAS domain S-box-containing protein